ncbi:hypothetical protein HYT01_03790 [Candidatus Giovannonibacteria bacterium]|nr:hypothetical protein [Candidatus Giovannonibacteria bacterium]
MLRIKNANTIALVLFHVVFLGIVVMNFPVGKFFIGWDALSPEFNFWINFKRALFPFWQENYGLGLLGGHGFTATLPHTIITFLLSQFLPLWAIRSVFTFLCLYLGGLGMYILTRKLLGKIDNSFLPYTALLASLFYMLNLGTLQMFYVQLEAFIVHFAGLPWLFLSAWNMLEHPSRRHILIFAAITFFASVQGFIPSLFISYATALGIFLIVYLLHARSQQASKRAGLVVLITFIINLYWLLPLAYFQFTRSDIYLHSYNNLISTPQFIDINRKYGDFFNVALLKGFLFESYELGDFILKPWIDYQNHALVGLIGYALFALIIIGFFQVFRAKRWEHKAFALIAVFFFASLATDTPPFSFVTNLLQAISPTYQQAFRATFTKFSVGLAFSYSILFALGIAFLLNILTRFTTFKHYASLGIIFVFFALLTYAYPTFAGNFLYKKLTLDIPQSYFALFDFFNNKGDGRIADFPQDCPEGWFAYKWGYFGSGFYWYAVQQPFLSRTFDVWSNYNENYYWEVSQALREEKYEKVELLFDKYHVNWILYDPNLSFCRNQKSVFTHQGLIDYLAQSKTFAVAKTFSEANMLPITIYERKKPYTSFVQTTSKLPTIGPAYQWNDSDTAYLNYGNYEYDKNNPDAYFPFRSLFTKRKNQEKEFSLSQQKDWTVFETSLPKNFSGYALTMKPYIDVEQSIPVHIRILPTTNGIYELYASLQFPQMYLDGVRIGYNVQEIKLGEIKTSTLNKTKLLIDGERAQAKNPENNIYEVIFYFTLTNTVTMLDEQDTVLFAWTDEQDIAYQQQIASPFSLVLPSYKNGDVTVYIPKIAQKTYGVNHLLNANKTIPTSCNRPGILQQKPTYEVGNEGDNTFLRLINRESNQCIVLNASDLITSFGYLLEVQTRNVQGNQLKLSITNKNKTVYNDTFIDSNDRFRYYSYVVPPSFANDVGYDIRIENSSENRFEAVNDIGDIRIWAMPYNFLKNLQLISPQIADIGENKNLTVHVAHPNETTYVITPVDDLSDATLLLSQSFDPGWKAYAMKQESGIMNYGQMAFPFFFGSELKDHVLVNNWANGWNLNNEAIKQSSNGQIVIVYLPQYLEYLGFAALFAPFIFIAVSALKKRGAKA